MTLGAADAGLPANLFLIGYRATGKSTVAALLAKDLIDSVDATRAGSPGWQNDSRAFSE